MKVTYLGHSGFLVEMDTAYFLFDYYTGELPALKPEKPLVVLSSHRHHDHYNKKIWELRKQYPVVKYVLSYDIPLSPRKQEKIGLTDREMEEILRVKPDQRYEIFLSNTLLSENGPNRKSLQVETFQSTDEGVAFFLTYEGRTIYHAGDLHLWLWEEEGKAYLKQMREDFGHFTEKLRGRSVDVAFLLLDSRLENTMYEGMDAYLRMFHASHVFPMHMWGQYEWIEKYLSVRRDMPQAGAIQKIEKDGQEFLI